MNPITESTADPHATFTEHTKVSIPGVSFWIKVEREDDEYDYGVVETRLFHNLKNYDWCKVGADVKWHHEDRVLSRWVKDDPARQDVIDLQDAYDGLCIAMEMHSTILEGAGYGQSLSTELQRRRGFLIDVADRNLLESCRDFALFVNRIDSYL